MTPVVITGIGVVSPLGCSVTELARRVAAGERVQPLAGADEGLTVPDIPLALLPAEKRAHIGRLDRFCRLFLSAAYLAVEQARLSISPANDERIGLSFGTGLGCLLTDEEYNRKVVSSGPSAASPRLFAYTVSSAPAGEVSIALGIKGPNVTAHMGLAAGLGAVGYGVDLLEMNQADVVLAGGADATGPALRHALAEMRLLKSDRHTQPYRDVTPGIFPSEGAALMVLERAGAAAERHAPSWGRIDGYAVGFEPTLARHARDPRGITATIARALHAAGRTPADIDLVLTSAHGTPLDDVERGALAAALGPETAALLVTPKEALGETFGASGPLALGLAAGLQRERPVVDGLVYDVGGRPLAAAAAAERLRTAQVVMINNVCYSGNVVCLVLTRTP